jgi:AAA family ATP:ADP antiporter
MGRRPSALARLLDLRPGERALVLRAGGVYALVLTANYMLRPLRDALALTGGSSKLPWLFTATFVGVLIAAPLIGWAAARLGRARLVEVVYGVCALVLVGLWGALGFGPRILASQAFFVWISIFNLIAVSMLWSVLADRLRTADAGRLFGLVAFGGSVGAIVGPTVAGLVATFLFADHLLLVAALLLIAALVVGRPLWGERRGPDPEAEAAPIGGSAWEGFVQVLRSPALAGICLYLLLMTTTATVVYFEQELIIERSFTDDASRTAALAGIDLAVNVLSLSAQALLTGRIIRRFGLGVALAVLPLVTAVGLGLLGLMPALAIVAGLQIVRRASNYALAKPAREVLFTAVPRSARYKAKSMIDTVIYRGGDALAGWAFTGLGALGLGLGAIAWVTAPLALLWTGLGWRLGANADAAERREDAPPPQG